VFFRTPYQKRTLPLPISALKQRKQKQTERELGEFEKTEHGDNLSRRGQRKQRAGRQRLKEEF